MRKSVSVLLILTLTLGACSTRLNPMNWFASGKQVVVEGEDNTLIPVLGAFSRKPAVYAGMPVGTVTALKIERVPGGAIIRASAVAPNQGSYNLRLTPENKDELPVNGILTYRFEAIQPGAKVTAGSTFSRTVTAARSVTNQTLKGVRSIKVVGAHNAMISRR